MVATIRVRAALVGEPAAVERAHRGGHAVGQQEHADQRAGDARDVLQERHDVGQRPRTSRRTPGSSGPTRRAPAGRTRIWPGRPRRGRWPARTGPAPACGQRDHGQDHDGAERAAPAERVPRQSAVKALVKVDIGPLMADLLPESPGWYLLSSGTAHSAAWVLHSSVAGAAAGPELALTPDLLGVTAASEAALSGSALIIPTPAASYGYQPEPPGRTD